MFLRKSIHNLIIYVPMRVLRGLMLRRRKMCCFGLWPWYRRRTAFLSWSLPDLRLFTVHHESFPAMTSLSSRVPGFLPVPPQNRAIGVKSKSQQFLARARASLFFSIVSSASEVREHRSCLASYSVYLFAREFRCKSNRVMVIYRDRLINIEVFSEGKQGWMKMLSSEI